jgi:hypothetical protein
LSKIYQVKVIKYNIYESRDIVIKSIQYINAKTNQVIEKKIDEKIRYYWEGKELSYALLRYTMRDFYLRYCDSLRIADSSYR